MNNGTRVRLSARGINHHERLNADDRGIITRVERGFDANWYEVEWDRIGHFSVHWDEVEEDR